MKTFKYIDTETFEQNFVRWKKVNTISTINRSILVKTKLIFHLEGDGEILRKKQRILCHTYKFDSETYALILIG